MGAVSDLDRRRQRRLPQVCSLSSHLSTATATTASRFHQNWVSRWEIPSSAASIGGTASLVSSFASFDGAGCGADPGADWNSIGRYFEPASGRRFRAAARAGRQSAPAAPRRRKTVAPAPVQTMMRPEFGTTPVCRLRHFSGRRNPRRCFQPHRIRRRLSKRPLRQMGSPRRPAVGQRQRLASARLRVPSAAQAHRHRPATRRRRSQSNFWPNTTFAASINQPGRSARCSARRESAPGLRPDVGSHVHQRPAAPWAHRHSRRARNDPYNLNSAPAKAGNQQNRPHRTHSRPASRHSPHNQTSLFNKIVTTGISYLRREPLLAMDG